MQYYIAVLVAVYYMTIKGMDNEHTLLFTTTPV